MSLVDGYPTILDGAGVDPPADEPPRPGRSWVEAANAPDDPDRVAFAEYHAMGASSAAYLVRRGRYKLHHYLGYDPELFDLDADPEETTKLAADPMYAPVVAEHQHLLRDICDPDEVDRRARADQAALIERFGGAERAARLGTVAETPAPETAPRRCPVVAVRVRGGGWCAGRWRCDDWWCCANVGVTPNWRQSGSGSV